MTEYTASAQLMFMMVPGSMEDERRLSANARLQDPARNRLDGNLAHVCKHRICLTWCDQNPEGAALLEGDRVEEHDCSPHIPTSPHTTQKPPDPQRAPPPPPTLTPPPAPPPGWSMRVFSTQCGCTTKPLGCCIRSMRATPYICNAAREARTAGPPVRQGGCDECAVRLPPSRETQTCVRGGATGGPARTAYPRRFKPTCRATPATRTTRSPPQLGRPPAHPSQLPTTPPQLAASAPLCRVHGFDCGSLPSRLAGPPCSPAAPARIAGGRRPPARPWPARAWGGGV